MDSLVFIIALGGIAVGLLVIGSGMRQKDAPVKQAETSAAVSQLSVFLKNLTARKNFSLYFIFGIAGGAIVGVLTGWPIMGLGIFASTVAGFWLFGSKSDREAHIARTEAIATWTEMIRDTIAGAAGLEEALIATGPLAPEPIAPEIQEFLNRLDYQPLDEALIYLGELLNHPSADLVVISLANSARLQAQNLGDVLTRLAASIRGDVTMRVRVEVGRAKIATSSKIVVGVSALTIVYLLFFARGLLEPYESAGGQLWLLVVFGVFWLGGWLLNFYSRIELPERFLARKSLDRQEQADL